MTGYQVVVRFALRGVGEGGRWAWEEEYECIGAVKTKSMH